METTRHKSVDVLAAYVRRVDLFKDHVGAAFPRLHVPGSPARRRGCALGWSLFALMRLALAAHAQPTEWRSYPFGSRTNYYDTDEHGRREWTGRSYAVGTALRSSTPRARMGSACTARATCSSAIPSPGANDRRPEWRSGATICTPSIRMMHERD
jgi:hypothetical protein